MFFFKHSRLKELAQLIFSQAYLFPGSFCSFAISCFCYLQQVAYRFPLCVGICPWRPFKAKTLT